MESFNSLSLPDGYLSELGRFVLTMGRLETSVCAITQALGVVDPALISTSTALRKARRQTETSMPPWARVDAESVRAWIDDVLALLRDRNKAMHWEIAHVQEHPDEGVDLAFVSPHDMDWLITGTEEISALVRRGTHLAERARDLIDELYYETDEGLVDPFWSLDGVGSGDYGLQAGVVDTEWPGSHRGRGGR